MKIKNAGRTVLLAIALLAAAGSGTNQATAFATSGRCATRQSSTGGRFAVRRTARALEQAPERRVIRMTAERFTFTPSRIVVETGEAIELRIASDDTAHGFRLQGTEINVVIPKRGLPETSATFTAPAPGKYAFECTRMCGAGHNFMRGELFVRERNQGAKPR